RAKDNPNEWLLAETERRLEAGRMRITEPSLGLRFDDPTGEFPIEELSLEAARIAPLAEFADAKVAEFVFLLLALTLEEETTVKVQDVQKLVLPQDYAELLGEHRRRMQSFAHVERDFMAGLA